MGQAMGKSSPNGSLAADWAQRIWDQAFAVTTPSELRHNGFAWLL